MDQSPSPRPTRTAPPAPTTPGVPASVTFNSHGHGEELHLLRDRRTALDDDGESVKLTFGTDNLPTGRHRRVPPTRRPSPSPTTTCPAVTRGIRRCDVQRGRVRRRRAPRRTKENEVSVTVTLSADPERTVTIPIDQDQPGRGHQRRLLRGAGQRGLQQRGHREVLHLLRHRRHGGRRRGVA